MNSTANQPRSILQRIARQVMAQRGLLVDFSAEATAQLAGIQAQPAACGQTRDLRNLLWASIDNDDSRDLDQLTVAEALPDGKTKILVAIADVDSVVHSGTPIDEHAKYNTTSVYTAAAIFPMLPERLSTDITSLGFNVDRLAMVAEMTVAADGSVEDASPYPALVRNKAKLAYNSVAAWLDGGTMPPAVAAVPGLDENLRLQDRVAQCMKGLRLEHGALTFETIQGRARFDGDQIRDIDIDKPNRAKQLIEDFMVAANGVTARYLASKKFPSIRRIVRTPKRWDRIVEIAGQKGFKLPLAPDSKALNDFLTKQKAADPIRFPDLSLSVIKLMGPGEYVAELAGETDASGHFGLAVQDYTHSTAPNRRYPDVVTQRLVKAAIAGQPTPYSDDALTELAAHCTLQEDAAKKVERQVVKSAAAMLLQSRIGEQFDAIVTGASEKGSWVRIFHPPVEGKLAQGAQGLDVGHKVRVQLLHTDVERGFIDFKRVA